MLALSFGLLLSACDSGLTDRAEPAASPETAETTARAGTERPDRGGQTAEGPFTFDSPVFDIATGPNGRLLVPETVPPASDVPEEGETSTSTIWEIGPDGTPRTWAKVTTAKGSPINGIEANGQSDLHVASGGTDEAVGAGLWQVSRGTQRLRGDIEAFEVERDPDLFAIEDWKDPACTPASGPFTPGPQSNPYHLARASGGSVLVADAAGNTLLRVRKSGRVEVVALFTPPTEGGGASADPADWLAFPFDGPKDGSCYVQPVPDAVSVGPDGSIFVGELTGVGALGVSRVWRIEPDARDVTCPSEACEVAFTGFTSIIDMAFGPEGSLFVVEYDENGWLTSVVPTLEPGGGTVNRCDLDRGTCTPVAEGLDYPSAVTFDKWGDLWLLEDNLGLVLEGPTVRRLE